LKSSEELPSNSSFQEVVIEQRSLAGSRLFAEFPELNASFDEKWEQAGGASKTKHSGGV
jgi:hypothetical protein